MQSASLARLFLSLLGERVESLTLLYPAHGSGPGVILRKASPRRLSRLHESGAWWVRVGALPLGAAGLGRACGQWTVAATRLPATRGRQGCSCPTDSGLLEAQ